MRGRRCGDCTALLDRRSLPRGGPRLIGSCVQSGHLGRGQQIALGACARRRGGARLDRQAPRAHRLAKRRKPTPQAPGRPSAPRCRLGSAARRRPGARKRQGMWWWPPLSWSGWTWLFQSVGLRMVGMWRGGCRRPLFQAGEGPARAAQETGPRAGPSAGPGRPSERAPVGRHAAVWHRSASLRETLDNHRLRPPGYPLYRPPGEYNFRDFRAGELLTEASPSVPYGMPQR